MRSKDNQPWGGMDPDERKKQQLYDEDRLRQLSQPKPRQYVLVKDEEGDLPQEELKKQHIMEKAEKNK